MAINDQLFEQLSALVDGELSELELRRLLKQLEQLSVADQRHVYERWQHYQLLSASMHAEQPTTLASPEFYMQVQQALGMQSEPAAVAPVEQATDSAEAKAQVSSAAHAPAWSRFAVAASVALAVIVGVQQFQINAQQGGLNDQTQLLATDNTVRELPVNHVANKAVNGAAQYAGLNTEEAISVSPLEAAEAQKRLNAYLLEHASSAASQSGQGMVPYVRVANFETE